MRFHLAMRRRNLLRSASLLLLSHALLCPAAPILSALPGSGAGRAQSPGAHSREFWRSIVRNNYAAPEGESAFVLARELSGLLGAPDPELRDNLAYSILATWIVEQRQFSQLELLSMFDDWLSN